MSLKLTPAFVATALGVRLPARYERYLSSGEWQACEGLWCEVPGYQSAMRLSFSGPELAGFFEGDEADGKHPASLSSASEAPLGGPQGWVPLATLGQEEARFLALSTLDANCPVAIWQPSTGTFTPVSHSLDAFLASLGHTAAHTQTLEPAVGAAALNALVERGKALLEGRRTKARLKDIEALLAELAPLTGRMPSSQSLHGSPYQRLPESAMHMKARLLHALGRVAEACNTLQYARFDGKTQMISPDTLSAMLLHDLNQPQAAAEVCAIAAQGRISSAQRSTWALALLRLGDEVGAAAQWQQMITTQAAAILKLYPKKTLAQETTECIAALREKVLPYAREHQLDAQAERLLVQLQHTLAPGT
jgi:hypothetical protein